jgi:hypothetical protein
MKQFLAKWILGGIIRDIAEGKKGKKAQDIYWWLAGKKTATAAIAGLLFAALATWQPEVAKAWAPTVTLVLGIAVSVGLVDKAWRDSPMPVEWVKAYKTLLSAGPAISAAVALVVELLPRVPGCESCSGWVVHIQEMTVAVAAATAWLSARIARPPLQ